MTATKKEGAKRTPSDEVETPSGIKIRFYEDKHQYEIGDAAVDMTDAWTPVPSVTQILDAVDPKGGLTWWGMRVGINGVLELYNRGIARHYVAENGAKHLVVPTQLPGGRAGMVVAGIPEIEAWLKTEKLTTNDIRDLGGVKGEAAHKAYERWAKDGIMPDPNDYPPTEIQYLRALRHFLEETDAEPVASEIMVASAKHGFAGRTDVRVKVKRKCTVVHHYTPVKGDQWAEVPKGEYIWDLKTSKDVYDSHGEQLEAYELASVECGYAPTKARGVIHLSGEGKYKLVNTSRYSTAEDFLLSLAKFKGNQARAERKKVKS